MNDIRETTIKLNKMMEALFIGLDIRDQLLLINVGDEPGDGTGDTICEAIDKTIENVLNLVGGVAIRLGEEDE